MTTMFKRNEIVRVVGEPKGSINEFARIDTVYDDGRFWITNMNMPFLGTISKIVAESEIAKATERNK